MAQLTRTINDQIPIEAFHSLEQGHPFIFSEPCFGRHPGLTGVTSWWYPLEATKVHCIPDIQGPRAQHLPVGQHSFFFVLGENIVQ